MTVRSDAAEVLAIDEQDPRCPRCDEVLDRDGVDVGVGIIYGPWGCECCGWSSDPQYDRSQGLAPADAEHPGCHVDQFGGVTPLGPVQDRLRERFGLVVDLVGNGEVQ